jgi:diguanylate cyclase (GGDEF)-like protein
MEMKHFTVLVLDETPLAKALVSAFDGHIVSAQGPLDASRLLAETPVDAIVAGGQVRWHLEFCQGLAVERRPAVLLVSPRLSHEALVDEWLPPSATASEWVDRLRLALSRARQRRLAFRRASQDFLTGLPNRRSFVRGLLREAARASRSGEGLSLVLIDLDHFKAVNERHGHAAGDRLLRRVGQALRSSTRESEVLGRIGGDEFALALAGREEVARRAARRFQEALARLQVSASIAVCEKLPHEDLRQLYRRCDGRLMEMKARRRPLAEAPFRNSPETGPWPH